MPFTAYDLRYHAEQSYPLLYAYLHRHAQRFLGALKYDAFEVDTVIGHVVEQLVRLGLFGGGDKIPLTALDRLTDAQFYTFLSRSVRNKAIDRLQRAGFVCNVERHVQLAIFPLRIFQSSLLFTSSGTTTTPISRLPR